MEAFLLLLNRVVEVNLLLGFKVKGRNGDEEAISHLLFADDTVVFCDDSVEHLQHLRWILLWFEAMVGLRVNLDKSFIYLVGDIVNSASLVEVVRCKVVALPTKYLGLPLGAKHNSLSAWDGIEERFRHRLTSWKRRYISKGLSKVLWRTLLRICIPSSKCQE